METNEQGKAEKTFKNFGKKVDEFMAELGEAGDKLQKEFNAKFEELKVSAEKLKNESENKERWKEVEESLKKAGDELSKAFKAAFKKEKVKRESRRNRDSRKGLIPEVEFLPESTLC